MINLKLCFPDKTDQWYNKIIRQSLQHTGKALFEIGAMWRWQESNLCNLVISTVNEEVLIKALNQDRGVILASPHIGAWELISIYVGSQHPMINMFRPSRMKVFDPIIRTARERFGQKMAPTNAAGVRMILKALSQKQIVGILPDQEPDRENGIFTPLYNTPACTMTLLSKLANKNQVPIVFCVMKRLKKGYELHYLDPVEDFHNRDIVIAATAVNQAVERCIAIAPEQYLWSYKRFRLLREGGKRSYRIKG